MNSRAGLRLLRSPLAWLVIVLSVEAGLFFAWLAFSQVRAPDISAPERGRRTAQRLGCFACHGAGANGGVANPGSDEGEVPAWSGGVAMMYIMEEGEIREWILDGMPKRLQGNDDGHDHGEGHGDGDSETEPPMAQLIHMPAYRGLITDEELDDLVAYFKVVALYDAPTDALAERGLEVAMENGCFGCHGPGGYGRIPNPGSFKGYVPGWDGPDFREVVRDDAELEEWILDGISKRFEKNPLARHFLNQQPIAMPAYRGRLSDDDLDALKAYINWVQSK